jgi:hypothetical protein
MPDGKPAGVRCVQLTDDNRCLIFDKTERPAVCTSLQAGEEMCGATADEAMARLAGWELLTAPDTQVS